MPTLYEPARDTANLLRRFGLTGQPAPPLVRPGEQGLFVRRPRAAVPDRPAGAASCEAVWGRWGLIPLFSPDGQEFETFEARSESAARERNFLQPWKRGHRCIVWADAVLQPDASSERLVRVRRADGQPLALAGLWNGWRSPAGDCVESFALLTLPGPGRGRERRTAILRDAWLDDWLSCPPEETAAYLRPFDDARLVRQAVEGSAIDPS